MYFVVLIAALVAQWLPAAAQVTVDSYFYGQSPLVAPVNGTGAGNWLEAYNKARAFVAELTLEEKVNYTGGFAADNGCTGYVNFNFIPITMPYSCDQKRRTNSSPKLPRHVPKRQWQQRARNGFCERLSSWPACRRELEQGPHLCAKLLDWWRVQDQGRQCCSRTRRQPSWACCPRWQELGRYAARLMRDSM